MCHIECHFSFRLTLKRTKLSPAIQKNKRNGYYSYYSLFVQYMLIQILDLQHSSRFYDNLRLGDFNLFFCNYLKENSDQGLKTQKRITYHTLTIFTLSQNHYSKSKTTASLQSIFHKKKKKEQKLISNNFWQDKMNLMHNKTHFSEKLKPKNATHFNNPGYKNNTYLHSQLKQSNIDVQQHYVSKKE